MFADYRVPQILRPFGALRYSEALAAKVDGKHMIASGSEEEVEIRAATVQAVEIIHAIMSKRLEDSVTHDNDKSSSVTAAAQVAWTPSQSSVAQGEVLPKLLV